MTTGRRDFLKPRYLANEPTALLILVKTVSVRNIFSISLSGSSPPGRVVPQAASSSAVRAVPMMVSPSLSACVMSMVRLRAVR